MTPSDHSRLHARRWGGKWEDYIAIDEWLDQTKYHFADVRHRAILHSGFGMQLAVQVFGQTIKVPGVPKPVPVRDIVQEHILQDLGFVPTIKDWLKHVSYQGWMLKATKETKLVASGKLDLGSNNEKNGDTDS